VSWGMRAATYLALDLEMIGPAASVEILGALDSYGPIPPLDGIAVEALQARLVKDKKTVQSRVHFVLPVEIGKVVVRADVEAARVAEAIRHALADTR
jgi:3-dehydroquinate synthetase